MFDVDDIVFARLEGYPFWPARVIKPQSHHLAHLGMTKMPSTHRLVLFYNDDGQYASMQTSDLRNFRDHRIQKKTSQYNGQHKSQLHVAFQAALKEYRLAHSRSNSHSPATNSPRRKPRPEKHPSSDITSPVTGHSDSRQPITPKTNKLSKQLTPRSTSPPNIPLQPSHRKTSSVHTMAYRAHPDTSPSTQPRHRSHPSNRKPSSRTLELPDPAHSQPSPSVQLRLRLKRTSSPSSPSSPLTQQLTQQTAAKRRRLVKSESDDVCPHLQPQRSARANAHSPSNEKPRPSIDKHDTAQPNDRNHKGAPEKDTSKSNRHARISTDHERIPRLTDAKHSHRTVEQRKGKSENAPAPTKSRQQRFDSKPHDSEKVVAQGSSNHETDEVRRIRKRKRSSKDSTVQLDDTDAESDPRKKEMPSASRRSPGEERALQSQQEQSTDIGAGVVDGDGGTKIEEKRRAEKLKKWKSTRTLKTDMGLGDRSTAFDHLTKSECIELIEHLQDAVRCNNVELWQRGIKLAEDLDIVKSEDGLKEACDGALQRAVEVIELMKCEKVEKSRVAAQEVDAYNACKALRDVYFDLDNVELKALGSRIVNVVKTIRTHSIKVSRVLMDVVVLWADLTTDHADQERAKQERAKQERAKQERAKQERAKQERAKQERAKQERAKQERAKQERAKQERAKQERAKQERAKQERAKQERAKQERAKQERAKQERAKQEHAKQEHAKQEHAKQEHAKQEHAKQEHAKQEHAKQEHAKQEHAKQEHAKQEHAKQEHAKQETANQESTKEESGSEELPKMESRQEEEDTETEKGAVEKKSSARERRLDKFDRKTCLGAMETVFQEDGKRLRMDENGRWVIAKRIEREIRPRLEEDRLGYYKASVNVIRGLRRALRHGVSKEEEDEEKGKENVAMILLLDAVKHNSREKTKQLVQQLNGR